MSPVCNLRDSCPSQKPQGHRGLRDPLVYLRPSGSCRLADCLGWALIYPTPPSALVPLSSLVAARTALPQPPLRAPSPSGQWEEMSFHPGQADLPYGEYYLPHSVQASSFLRLPEGPRLLKQRTSDNLPKAQKGGEMGVGGWGAVDKDCIPCSAFTRILMVSTGGEPQTPRLLAFPSPEVMGVHQQFHTLHLGHLDQHSLLGTRGWRFPMWCCKKQS